MPDKPETINVMLPIKIEEGKSGLFFITSPVIKGLLVSGNTEWEARDSVQGVIQDMARAALEL